jgi:ABC-type transporter Mla MlaB component
MLRITLVSQTKKEVVLKLEGWVSEENVVILEQEGARHLREAGRLVLDLTGVQFIDETGIALLRRWSGERLTLRSGSPFLGALLTAHGLGDRILEGLL